MKKKEKLIRTKRNYRVEKLDFCTCKNMSLKAYQPSLQKIGVISLFPYLFVRVMNLVSLYIYNDAGNLLKILQWFGNSVYKIRNSFA